MAAFAFDCLSDPAAFVIDGANRTCRLAGASATWLRVGTVLLALLCIVCLHQALTRDARAPRVHAVRLLTAVACALGAAVPGILLVLFVRADAPLHAAATAAQVRSRMAAFAEVGEGLACVDIERDECSACQPLAQLVYLACDAKNRGAGGKAVFEANAFSGAPCERRGDRVICGAPPSLARASLPPSRRRP